jgi:exopolyphosphatase/guanosine-5'-triphosphate,3'-diphosphate pyrophosphatase
VAALALGQPAYVRVRIHLSRLGAQSVREVTDRCLAMTRALARALPVMHRAGRRHRRGRLVLATVVDRLGLPEVS